MYLILTKTLFIYYECLRITLSLSLLFIVFALIVMVKLFHPSSDILWIIVFPFPWKLSLILRRSALFGKQSITQKIRSKTTNMAKRSGPARRRDDESLLTRAVDSVFTFIRFAEFEILFVLFFVVAFIIFKDLVSPLRWFLLSHLNFIRSMVILGFYWNNMKYQWNLPDRVILMKPKVKTLYWVYCEQFALQIGLCLGVVGLGIIKIKFIWSSVDRNYNKIWQIYEGILRNMIKI